MRLYLMFFCLFLYCYNSFSYGAEESHSYLPFKWGAWDKEEKKAIMVLANKVLMFSDYLENRKLMTAEQKDVLQKCKKKWCDKLKISEKIISDSLEKIRFLTMKLFLGELEIDEYISILLKSRSNFLRSRSLRIDKLLNVSNASFRRLAQADDDLFVIPTDVELLDFFTDFVTDDEKEFNKKISFDLTMKYEFIQLIIRDAFRVCKVSKLSEKTIKEISAAVHLHPMLISDNVSNIGHPDEATRYTLIKELLFNNEFLSSLFIKFGPGSITRKNKAYLSKLLKVRYVNNAINEFIRYREYKFMHPYKNDRSFRTEAVEKIYELGLAERLESKIKGLDYEIFDAHCTQTKIERVNYEGELNHVCREWELCDTCSKYKTCKKRHCRPDLGWQYIEGTKYELGLYEYPLKVPGFLKRNSKKRDVLAELERIIAESKKTETESVVTEINEVELEIEEEKNSNEGEVDENEDEDVKNSIEEELAENELIDYKQQNKINARLNTKNTNKTLKKERFLTEKNLQTLEIIFFHSKGKLTYMKFQRLWKALGGHIKNNNGGSHKTLFYGKEALGGIFSHGKKQEYGKGFYKWLKEPILKLSKSNERIRILLNEYLKASQTQN